VPNPFRLSKKTQFIAHNGQLYTVAEVEKADWKEVPVGSLIFIAQSRLGSSYYCDRAKAVLIPVISMEAQAGRITANGLGEGTPLLLEINDSSGLEATTASFSFKSIFRIYYPIAVTALPLL
jgi:hypothetical protein